jgi:hypothetical protein
LSIDTICWLTRFVDSDIFIDQNSWFNTNRESTF